MIFLIVFGSTLTLELSSCIERCGPFDIHDYYILRFKSMIFENGQGEAMTDEVVPINDLSLYLYVDSARYVKNRGIKPSFDLFTTAYACSPAEPTSLNYITDYKVYADVAISDSLPAGVNLVDCFLFKSSYYAISYDAFLHHNSEYGNLGGFQGFKLIWKENIVDKRELYEDYKTFHIVLYLSDSTVHTLYFNRILITR